MVIRKIALFLILWHHFFHNQIFAPLGDLARELRYGRVEETFGEDGFLAGEIGYAYIVGEFWADDRFVIFSLDFIVRIDANV